MIHFLFHRNKYWTEWKFFSGYTAALDEANWMPYRHHVRMIFRECTKCGRKEMKSG